MSAKRAGLLAALLAGLIAVQHFGLETQAETIAEAPMKRVAGLPASDVLPTYIASLFFGAFRAVAVDVLWIQLRRVEEEKRWYERREIIKLISYVQPRNPEVWAHLGWHSAYNVANGFTDPEKSWEWVKFGLLWLRKGISTLPNEPYLKNQLAYTLWHKPSWRDGMLDLPLLKRVEQDAELQAALLPDGVKADRPYTMFELAILWLQRAGEEITLRGEELTQMGLYLYPDTMDGYVRLAMMLQGIYEWKLERPEPAKEWFRKAKAQCDLMLAKKYRSPISPIYADRARLYAAFPDIIDLERRARSGRDEDLKALVAKIQGVLVELGPIDEGWLWSRYDETALLNRAKIALSKGVDLQESNDSPFLASELRAGDQLLANLAPEGLDVDFYLIRVPAPPGEPAPAVPPRPLPVTLTLKRPQSAGLDLKLSILDATQKVLKTVLLRGAGTHSVSFPAPDYGGYWVKVEAGEDRTPWPADTRYSFQYSVAK